MPTHIEMGQNALALSALVLERRRGMICIQVTFQNRVWGWFINSLWGTPWQTGPVTIDLFGTIMSKEELADIRDQVTTPSLETTQELLLRFSLSDIISISTHDGIKPSCVVDMKSKSKF